ncbi:MAG: peptidylprolyl isomerase [Phycisphaerae bacterium]
MMCRIGSILVAAAVSAASLAQESAPAAATDVAPVRVKLETSLGDIVLELDAKAAPITVDNFVMYCGQGFYNGTVFHRVIPTFMIQGGGYTEDMEQKQDGLRKPIQNEWRNGLANKRGTISMARLGGQADSATAQFFINVVDNERLDTPNDGAAYCVFGHVVEGMDVVDKIKDSKLIKHPKLPFPQPVTPETPVVITSASVLTKYDRAPIEPLMAQSAERIAKYTAEPMLYQEELLRAWIEKAEKEGGGKLEAAPSGLRWVTLKPGTGPVPTKTDTVEVHYTGWLAYGGKFDSSVDRGQPYQVKMSGGVVPGWLEALSTMKVGEKRRVFIPPDLGYGERGSPPRIPPNSLLIFDMELVGIKP